MRPPSKVLFILKRREDYNAVVHSAIGLSTGLYNSANFMNEMLNESGIESKLVVVTDNNDIDREVSQYKPTHVIIEALWVIPSKFSVLQKLHPNVTWIVRMHSETPFVAGEGMAMDWLGEYSNFQNVIIACNTPRFLQEIRNYLQFKNSWCNIEAEERVIYLPNYYPNDYRKKKMYRNKDHVDVGCFGAIRPLKNHLLQAMSAVKFAEDIGKSLFFHVNIGRIEMKGDAVFHNLRGMFEQLHDRGHRLINHQWTPRENFLELCASMDIGMQVSFSETFNIVGADFVSQGVPLVGSKEIPWSSSLYNANPTESCDITAKLHSAYSFPTLNTWRNQNNLTAYCKKTRKIWVRYFGS